MAAFGGGGGAAEAAAARAADFLGGYTAGARSSVEEANGRGYPGRDAASSSRAPQRKSAAEEAFLQDWATGSSSLRASSADYYFDSYNHYGVHEDILKDYVTMSSYSRAIKQNAHLFRGAVVLDVGAGLGICSLLAAKAGARRVIALEAQQELVAMGSRVAAHNGFGPEVIQFVCGTADALDALPDGIEEVDIIVSEWAGYFLMYEARLADVLRARDRWLKKPGGLMFPDRARIHVALMEDLAYTEQHFDFYADVWGFDYTSMSSQARCEPVVNVFEESQVLSTSACILNLDLYQCKASDCFELGNSFQVECKRPGVAHAALAWFEICFDSCHKPISFSTGPDCTPTCWKQTAFFLSGVAPSLKDGDRVRGMIVVRKASEAKRHIDIKIALGANSGQMRSHFFRWT